MKIKHLFLLAFLASVIITAAVLILDRKEAAITAAAVTDQVSFQQTAGSVSDEDKWELISTYIIRSSPSWVHSYDVEIGPGHSGVRGGGHSDGEAASFPMDWTIKQHYLEDYVQHAPAGTEVVGAAILLAYHAAAEGDFKQAEAFLSQARKRLTFFGYAYGEQQLMLEWVKLAMASGHPQRVQSLIKSLVKEEQTSASNAPYQTLLEAAKLPPTRSSTVTGVIKRSDGTPITDAGVYLRQKGDANHSVVNEEPYQTMTNSKGEFTFHGVLPGSYQLNLGLRLDQVDGWSWQIENDTWIDIQAGERRELNVEFQPLIQQTSPVNNEVIHGDTMTFAWEPVAGAAYYNVNIGLRTGKGDSMNVLLKDRIASASLRVPIEELYDTPITISFGKIGDWSSVETESLLGFENPQVHFHWNVEAFDRNGHFISRSNGYRLDEENAAALPLFKLAGLTLTPADQLLLDHKMEEALRAYKRSYEENRSDLHSLRMIIRLLQSKATVMEGGKPSSAETGSYLQQMTALNPDHRYLEQLFDYYNEHRKWSQLDQVYRKITADPAASDLIYLESEYAEAIARQGRYEEAEMLLARNVPRDASHRSIGLYAALHLYLHADLAGTLELVRRYPDRTLYIYEINHSWEELLSQLAAKAEQNSAYAREIHEKLGWFLGGKEQDIHAWLQTTRDTPLKAFIETLQKVK
ncbi:carboxypeptidase-like regulatory domain-containing protein [Paenibacillus lacisoli]|nr:carboxypeptidase-like regulatory domain-containing protein [Paenibacillus sp. JX-17]